MRLDTLTVSALILTIVGGLNWGLVGLFNFDLVQFLFVSLMNLPFLATLTYILVGLASVISLFKLFVHESPGHRHVHA